MSGHIIKWLQKNISFFKCDDESYLIIDQYLSNWYGNEYAYNYYSIHGNNIMLYKSDNEYFIRYIDADKPIFAPLQTKIKNFFGNMHKLKNNITLVSIKSDDEELFKKLREIWNRIPEIIGINNAPDFVKQVTLDNADDVIMVDVHENTSFVKVSNSDELVIVLLSVIDNDLKTSLVQAKTVFSCLPTFNNFQT